MNTTQLEFADWWEDWLQNGHEREEFHDALERLFRFVDLLPPVKRDAFASELTGLACRQGKAWHIALGALERLAGRDAFERLSRVAIALPAVHPPHPLVDYRIGILRVLGKDASGEFLGPVDAYCAGEVDSWFTSVAWALWPHHKERFARCHARYFIETPQPRWSGTAVIQAFLTRPQALGWLRNRLISEHPATWNAVRTEVLAACSGTWTDDEQANEIRRLCGGGVA
jgi:hypothetical protein